MTTDNIHNKKPNISDYLHPLYNNMFDYWDQIIDFHDNYVKDRRTKYLPKTGGQLLDTEYGDKRYERYLERAVYYNFTKQTVRDSKNTIVRKPAVFEVSQELEYLKENFNDNNESILSVLDDTYYEQIKMSRVGRLVDIATTEQGDVFQSIEYKCLSILSWNEQSFFNIDGVNKKYPKRLVYLLLNETSEEINDNGIFETKTKFRVLGLRYTGNKEIFRYYTILLDENEVSDIKYFTSPDMFDESYILNTYGERYIEPNYKEKTLNFIPFTFINLDNLNTTPQIPILYDQTEISKALYQGEANYREIIQQQTVNTLFGKGINSEDPIIAGGQFFVSSENADLKYVGIDTNPLEEVRISQANLKLDCQNFGGVEVQSKNTNESGKALETRVTLQTDKLRDISKNGVAGLVQQLRFIALWSNIDINTIYGEANEDFRTEKATTKDLKDMGEMYRNGEITEADYYTYQFENSYTDYNYNEWKENIKKEKEKEEVIINDNDSQNIDNDV